jgi:hypothetical protein
VHPPTRGDCGRGRWRRRCGRGGGARSRRLLPRATPPARHANPTNTRTREREREREREADAKQSSTWPTSKNRHGAKRQDARAVVCVARFEHHTTTGASAGIYAHVSKRSASSTARGIGVFTEGDRNEWSSYSSTPVVTEGRAWRARRTSSAGPGVKIPRKFAGPPFLRPSHGSTSATA